MIFGILVFNASLTGFKVFEYFLILLSKTQEFLKGFKHKQQVL